VATISSMYILERPKPKSAGGGGAMANANAAVNPPPADPTAMEQLIEDASKKVDGK